LGTEVNLPGVVDSCAAISKDGLSFYFSSNRQNPTNLLARDLYVTTRERVEDPWGTPVALVTLNSDTWDSCPALSLDEHRLYFTTRRAPSCGLDDIWVSRRHDRQDDLGWEAPVSLGCEQQDGINTAGRDLAPAFFEDEAGREVMYFASTRDGGSNTARADHYQSIARRDGTFGPGSPIAELNSAVMDLGITVRRDGLEVFLISTRLVGSGVYANFWRATRASTDDPWSAPEFVPSLGNPAYAQGRIALSFDGRELYFTSTPGGAGYPDIWVARRERVRGPQK